MEELCIQTLLLPVSEASLPLPKLSVLQAYPPDSDSLLRVHGLAALSLRQIPVQIQAFWALTFQ